MDDRADKVVKRGRGSDFQVFCLGDQGGFECWIDGGGDVGAGGGAAFLALVFKGTADGLDKCVVEVGALVDKVKVLATCFADDAGIAFVLAVRDALGNLAVEGAEDGGAASVMETSELRMGEDDICDQLGVARNKLDDVWRKSCLEEDAVDQIVGCNGRRGGFPDDNIAHQSWRAGKVATNCGEVEW